MPGHVNDQSSGRGRLLAAIAGACLVAAAGCAGPAAAPAPAPSPAAADPPGASGPVTGSVTSTSAPSGSLPYTADWSSGTGGWTGSPDWSATGGDLLTSGQGYSDQAGVQAPVDLTDIDAYTVDADIQLVRYTDGGAFSGQGSFGIIVRGQSDGSGYGAGVCAASGIYSCTNGQNTDQVAVLQTADGSHTVLDSRPFRPGGDWHHFHITVNGNTIDVQIDQAQALSASDNTYLHGQRVGLWADRSQIAVRDFRITDD